MPNQPVQYIPFFQTVAPLYKVIQAQAIVETKAGLARQAATWAAHTQAGVSGIQRFAKPSNPSDLAPDASVPEEVRGSVFRGSS